MDVKKLLGVLVCMILTIPLQADDDVMITRDGVMTPVKIERITTTQVQYIDLKHKKSGSQTVSANFVYMIMKEKGNNIFFDEEGSQTTSPVVKFDKKDNVLFLNIGSMYVIYNMTISKDEIKYQLSDKKKDPFQTTKKSDVFMVRNSDGTTTLYYQSPQERQQSTAPQTVTSAAAAPATQTALPPSSRRYRVGDIYQENGLKGIVVQVDQSGGHGLIMSLTADGSRWSKGGDLKTETECFDQNDGQKNLEAIERYVAETGCSWDDFPMFKWAKSLGDGWYIPANSELEVIAKAINGGTMDFNEKVVDEFGKKIKKAGGDQLINKGFGHQNEFKKMFSSTEIEGGTVYNLELVQSRGSAISSALFGKFSKMKGSMKLTPTIKNLGNVGVKLIGTRAVHKF